MATGEWDPSSEEGKFQKLQNTSKHGADPDFS